MTKKIRILLLFVVVLHHIVLAQSNVKDSLYRQLQKPQADTTKVLLLLEIADVCSKDSSNYYKEKALALSLQNNYDKGLGRCYFRMNTGKEGEEALNGLRKAVPYSQKSADWSNLTEIFNGIGIYYRLKGDYDSALFYHQKALDLALKYKDTKNLARSYTNKGVIYRTQGNYQKAIENYYLGLQMDEKAGDLKGMSVNYNNIGNIYYNQGEYQKAKSYYEKSIILKEKAKDLKGLSLTLANLASCLYELKQTTLAIESAEKGLAIAEKNKFQNNIAVASAILAEIYIDEKKDFLKSLAYLEKGMKAIEETKSNDKISQFQGLYAHYYNAKGEFQQAYEWADKGQALSEKIGNTENAMQAHYEKSIAAEKLGKYDAAYQSHRRYIFWKDSIENEKNLKNALSKEFAYKEEKSKIEQEKKALEHEQQLKQQRYFSYAILGALGFMLIIASVIYRSQQKEKKSKELLTKQNDEILHQKEEIQIKNKDILDSINVGRRIQHATLPNEKEMAKNLKDFFIFYEPKDLVSGDFYWFHEVTSSRNAHAFHKVIALADSTGHGVPGAFVSMIGHNLLNEIVKVRGIYSPEQILNELRISVMKALKQDENGSREGMDITVLAYEKRHNDRNLFFAGAMNPLYYVQQGEFKEIKGDKISIGGNFIIESEKDYTLHTIEIEAEEEINIWLCTDGYQDQFGGEKDKKFMVGALKKLLFSIAHLPSSEQKEVLATTFLQWKGENKQIDDVSILGIKI